MWRVCLYPAPHINKWVMSRVCIGQTSRVCLSHITPKRHAYTSGTLKYIRVSLILKSPTALYVHRLSKMYVYLSIYIHIGSQIYMQIWESPTATHICVRDLTLACMYTTHNGRHTWHYSFVVCPIDTGDITIHLCDTTFSDVSHNISANRMAYVCRSFSVKQPCHWVLICGKDL